MLFPFHFSGTNAMIILKWSEENFYISFYSILFFLRERGLVWPNSKHFAEFMIMSTANNNLSMYFTIKCVIISSCVHRSEVHEQKRTLRAIYMNLVCVFGFLTLSLNFWSQCNFCLYQLGLPDHNIINLLY